MVCINYPRVYTVKKAYTTINYMYSSHEPLQFYLNASLCVPLLTLANVLMVQE